MLEIVTVLIAALTGVVGWLLGRRTVEVAQEQLRVDALAFAGNWYTDLRTWASEAIDVLSEAVYRSIPSPDRPLDPEVLFACRYRLSALIDRGRFFLPNQRTTEHGMHKPTAYRGFRHSALDPLVAAEHVLGGETGTFPDQAAALVALRREFVSVIQDILAPARHNEAIARVVRHADQDRTDDPSLGGLLPNSNEVPQGASSILQGAPARPPRA